MREKRDNQMNIMERINSFSFNKGFILKSEEFEEEDDDQMPIVKKSMQSNKISQLTQGVTSKPLMIECLKLGQTFKSFVDVSQAITMYEIQNRVHLTHKYFRRIAANPKPSNKEDFMLTEEERKRFVYRWVDFCCTYFDDMLLTRTDHDDGDGNETAPVSGFAMKECPMRIRFQLRFNEKDLMISIFRETHDHNHPTSEMPKNAVENQPTSMTSYTDLGNSNCPRRQPPSLAPVPTPKAQRQPPVSYSDSNSHGHSAVSPLNLKLQMHFRNSVSMPKPPPLKAMPSLSCNNAETLDMTTSKELSGESIIKNIYGKLRRLHAEGLSCESGLRFTSPKPDIIKITSELSGVDERKIMEICHTKRPYHVRATGNKLDRNSSATASLITSSCSSLTPMRKVMKPSEETHSKFNTNDMNFSHFSVPFVNYPQKFNHRSFDDLETEARFVNMPVEVIIKSEPDEVIDYYDENDSNSSTTINEDYTDTNKPDAPR